MPVTATTAESLFIGAGEVYVDGVTVGATMENNVARFVRQYFRPELNGVKGPLAGTDYIQSEVMELEVTLPEITAATMALALPGTTSTSRATTVTGGGGDTTLAAAAIAGQMTGIKLTAVTGFSVGDYVRFGAGTTPSPYQYAKLTRVGTLGSGGTGVDIDRPLYLAIANGEDVTEVVGDGATVIEPDLARRLPSTALHAWSLVVPGIDGSYIEFQMDQGIMTDNAEFEAADDGTLAPRLTLQSRWTVGSGGLVVPHRILTHPALVLA
jgi:hypothetical protein